MDLGTILTHSTKDGAINFISYANRAFTDVEARYCQTEYDILAICWAHEKFHHYVYREDFPVVTDHKPLLSIFNKVTTKLTPIIKRRLSNIQPYRFRLVYQPEMENMAEFLPRHSINSPHPDD